MTPSSPRYCSTCGALLTPEAALCGECGTRFTASPFEKRSTEAPGAWASAPAPHRPAVDDRTPRTDDEDRIELVSRESLRPPRPGATTVRPSDDQYDRRMSSSSAAPAPSWSAPPASSPTPATQLDPPLDGCKPAGLLQRLGAALIDGLVSSLLAVPLLVGLVLIGVNARADLLSQILIGLGAALVLAAWLVFAWLQGQRGITPGKAILGLRTVRMSSGGTIGFLRALARAILLGIPVVQLVAIVMILVDARTRRGLHDRAVDSIVLGVRTGRNPLLARPDDYARHADAHYIPQSPSAVAAHDNLMAQPGTPWGIGSADAPVHATGWESSGPEPVSDGVIERSPWAPSTGESRVDGQHIAEVPAPAAGAHLASDQGHAGADGFHGAHGPQDPHASHGGHDAHGPAAPASYGASWGSPAPAPQQSWQSPQPPAPQAPSQPSPTPAWGSPAPAPGASAAQPNPWGTPAAPSSSGPGEAPWGSQAPAPQEPSWDGPAPQATPYAAPEAAAAQVPAPRHEVPQEDARHAGTTPEQPERGWADASPSASEPPRPDAVRDPWTAVPAPAGSPVPPPGGTPAAPRPVADGELDATSAVEDLEDLERTRISRPRAARAPRLRVGIDGEEAQELVAPVVVGRNPSGEDPGASVLAVADSTRSVSKVHLLLEISGGEIVVSDLGSTNGTSVRHEDGTTVAIEPGNPTRVASGAELALGDRTLVVELLQ